MIEEPSSKFEAVLEDKFRDELYTKLREHLTHERTGVHVSDLINPLRAYFEKTQPLPLTEDEIGYFTAGRAHHELLQLIFPGQKVVVEDDIEWEGIVGHIDVVGDGLPVEIKTSRAWYVTPPESLWEENSGYIRQLSFYCAIKDQPEGKLIVFLLANKIRREDGTNCTVPRLIVYKVKFSDLDGIRQDLINRRDLLLDALKNKNPALLPPCPEYLCKAGENGCKYKGACKEYRGK